MSIQELRQEPAKGILKDVIKGDRLDLSDYDIVIASNGEGYYCPTVEVIEKEYMCTVRNCGAEKYVFF